MFDTQGCLNIFSKGKQIIVFFSFFFLFFLISRLHCKHNPTQYEQMCLCLRMCFQKSCAAIAPWLVFPQWLLTLGTQVHISTSEQDSLIFSAADCWQFHTRKAIYVLGLYWDPNGWICAPIWRCPSAFEYLGYSAKNLNKRRSNTSGFFFPMTNHRLL